MSVSITVDANAIMSFENQKNKQRASQVRCSKTAKMSNLFAGVEAADLHSRSVNIILYNIIDVEDSMLELSTIPLQALEPCDQVEHIPS